MLENPDLAAKRQVCPADAATATWTGVLMAATTAALPIHAEGSTQIGDDHARSWMSLGTLAGGSDP